MDSRSLTLFLDSIIEHLPAMIFVKDARDLRFERFNRAGEELLGLSRSALIGKTDYDFFPKEQADFFVAKDREVLRRKTLEDIPEEPIATPRGTRWLHTRKIPILGPNGEPTHLLGVSIDITDRKEAEAARVKADPVQLEQVLMNLVVNARDAMPRGGRLAIETAVAEVREPEAGALGVRPGSYVALSVGDTGIGMDKAVLGRIFEPFFTTKEKGKGTGLGLSTAFGIVRQTGGAIAVSSEPGRGSTFTVYLPLTQEAESKAPQPQAGGVEARGTETILLVEDEEQVRGMTARILEERGYRVISTRRASEAMAQAAVERGTIHLLLTDVIMPETGGRLLAEELISTRPDMRVLFMSGYTDDAMVRYGVLESGLAFLQKPFTPEELARRVRETLDAPARDRKRGLP